MPDCCHQAKTHTGEDGRHYPHDAHRLGDWMQIYMGHGWTGWVCLTFKKVCCFVSKVIRFSAQQISHWRNPWRHELRAGVFFENETPSVVVYIQTAHPVLICAVYGPCFTPPIGHWLGVITFTSQHTGLWSSAQSLAQKPISNTMMGCRSHPEEKSLWTWDSLHFIHC